MNSAEPELAKKDFEEVLKLDPKNSSAARNINTCIDLLKKQRSQEKKIYANMFEKFAKHDKEVSEKYKWMRYIRIYRIHIFIQKQIFVLFYWNKIFSFVTKDRNWVYGWWDGKQVNTDKYVPAETAEEEIIKRKKERNALLKELQKKKTELSLKKEKNDKDDSNNNKNDTKILEVKNNFWINW